ncbi:DNA topoisomerase III, partial [Rhodoblastus sphagnicola]
DPQTIREAFGRAKPNSEYSRIYAAAVARRQADQIYNLSLTRTATVSLGKGAPGVIGIGRVKTPTLAIVCRRELEIRDFVPVAYFEIVAKATVAGGEFQMRHAPRERILQRAKARDVANAANGFEGPLAARVEEKRQKPPKLHDLPSLQKLCGSRFGWSAAKTLELAQELYDGQGKKIITYPRAEVRYLPESAIDDAAKIVAGLREGQTFRTIPMPEPLHIRKGAAGSFYDKGLEGASHHAVIPNVNTISALREVWPRLSLDEKKLFDVIARAYLAALMPDFRYRQTSVTLDVGGFAFRSAGRQPIEMGWRAAFPEWTPAEEKGDEAQLLPALRNGEPAKLSHSKIEAKETRPPPRYNEGGLIEAMQNAWRFVDDEALRERLKEAKGIGTPATRAEIIGGLKRQGFLTAQGKNIVPTEAGLSLFGVLKRADPDLVDPGVTARLEYLLDDVVLGKQEMIGAIDAVCDVAQRIIGKLTESSGGGPPLLGARGGSATRPPASTMKPYAGNRTRRKVGVSKSGRRSRKSLDLGAEDSLDTTADVAVALSAVPSEGVGSKLVAAGGRSGRKSKKAPAKRSRSATDNAAPSVAHAPPSGPRSATETPLRIPFGNKAIALDLGARYRTGGWYAPPGVDLAAFGERGWL